MPPCDVRLTPASTSRTGVDTPDSGSTDSRVLSRTTSNRRLSSRRLHVRQACRTVDDEWRRRRETAHPQLVEASAASDRTPGDRRAIRRERDRRART